MDSNQNASVTLKDAQRKIGIAIGACLAVWYAPVVSGVACNIAEKALVKELLETFGETSVAEKADRLFWFHRKKMLLFNVATYAPWVGTSLQILEVYSMGQFTIRCITPPGMDLTDEVQLAEAWEPIMKEMFSGESVVRSYEQFSGERFPDAIKPRFIEAVDFMGRAYLASEKIPGLMVAQEYLGGAAQRGVAAVSEASSSVRKFFKNMW